MGINAIYVMFEMPVEHSALWAAVAVVAPINAFLIRRAAPSVGNSETRRNLLIVKGSIFREFFRTGLDAKGEIGPILILQ